MKALITTTAPTSYQASSLRAFKLDKVNKCPYSSETVAYSIFNTVAEAREYLKDLAFEYYDGDKKAIDWHSGKDYLELDACTAKILTGYEYEQFINSDNRNY